MATVGHLQQIRLEYFDRVIATSNIQYGQTLAGPHTVTVRATYTVPTGRLAFIEVCALECARGAAATVLGFVEQDAVHTPSGGTGMVLLRAGFNSIAVGALSYETITQAGIARAGDVLHVSTLDTSTGGDVYYSGGIKLIEFAR